MRKYMILLSAALLSTSSHAYSAESADSVDTYTGQTVSGTQYVQGRSLLTVSDISVTGTGHLIISSPDGVDVTHSLSVANGGTLEITGGKQRHVRYTYDASGNRVCRRQGYSGEAE